jgi:hypothetical protein
VDDSPRPSVLLVSNQSVPSGATTTSRRRPYTQVLGEVLGTARDQRDGEPFAPEPLGDSRAQTWACADNRDRRHGDPFFRISPAR